MSPRKIEITNRFWSKVTKGSNCWEWQASKTADGYGRFGIGRKLFLSHRVAYELTNGPIPEGIVIDHKCRSRSCVNPSHLRAATHKENLENRDGATVKNVSSGIRGVSFHKATGKWMAYAGHNGRIHYGGLHLDVAQAQKAAITLRKKLFTHNEVDKEAAHVQPN